jgi:PhnB protein
MQFTPYLQFDGRCEAAFKFYERCFGGKIAFMVSYADTPMSGSVPPDWAKKLCHATLMVGDAAVMGCDAPPGRYETTKGVNITFNVKNPEDAERIFNTLAENGKVIMAMEKTFWALRFGMVVDQFGIPWMINCENATRT